MLGLGPSRRRLLVFRLCALKLAPDTLKRGVAQDSLVALCSGNRGQRPEEHHGEGAYQESHGHDYDRSGSEKSKHFLRRFGFENLGEIAAAEMRSPQKGGDYKERGYGEADLSILVHVSRLRCHLTDGLAAFSAAQ